MALRMAEGTKPYRLYRGGRVKGRSPLGEKRSSRPEADPCAGASRAPPPYRPLARAGGRRGPPPGRGLGRPRLPVVLGRGRRRTRLPRAASRALARHDGSLLSDPATILVVGTDGGKAAVGGMQDAPTPCSCCGPTRGRTASRTSPSPVTYASRSPTTAPKINAANQLGGPALTIETVRELTGLPVHHVVVVDFDGFRELIDAIGGIEVNVPRPILSNKFDCPYSGERCREWEGLALREGHAAHGRPPRARVLAHRTNQLDPSETDISRGSRQRAVAEAVGDEIASFSTFLRLPFAGDSLAAPLATDLSAWELVQLGWVRFRADTSKSLHCRLGGDPASLGGVRAHRLGGERRRDLDVPPPLGALAPPRGHAHAPGCTRR